MLLIDCVSSVLPVRERVEYISSAPNTLFLLVFYPHCQNIGTICKHIVKHNISVK